MATKTAPKAEEKQAETPVQPKQRLPHIGQQVVFVMGKDDSRAEYMAFCEHVHEDIPGHLIDLTYFTRDARGAAFAATIPYDAEGLHSHSWSFRGDGK